VEVLRPGVYRVDRLTVNAIRASAHDLVREGLICFEDDRDIVAPIVPAQDIADEVQAEFHLDPVRLEDMA